MAIIVKGGGGKPEEEKTVTAGTSVIEVNPSSGKAMKKVTVNPTPTESKSVTPTTSELTVTPSEGKHLSQVVVGAVEDVTPEVTAQTPVITQIAENLGATITTPSGTNKQILQGNNANLLNIKNNAKKEGLYVWKKYEYVPPVTVDFSKITLNSSRPSSTLFEFSSNDFDVSAIENYKEFFNGLVASASYRPAEFFINSNGDLVLGDGSTKILEWDPSTRSMKTSQTFGSTYGVGEVTVKSGDTVRTLYNRPQIFIDYVVSDHENAYPDGELHTDGYWYEKVVEGIDLKTLFGCTKMAIDTFTFTSNTTARDTPINHSLGETPKIAIVITKEKPKVNDAIWWNLSTDQTDGILRNLKSTTWRYNSSNGYAISISDASAEADNSTFTYAQTTPIYAGGVEYTLITMA